MLFGVGQVERPAVLAAVDFGVLTKPPLDLVAEEIPAFQVPGAKFAFLVLLIAGAHAGQPLLDLRAVAQRNDDVLFSHRDQTDEYSRERDGQPGNCVALPSAV